MDAKIDMLHRSKACTPNQAGSTDDEIDEEEDEVETSLGDDSVEQGDDVEDGDTWDSELSRSPSPLAGKGQQKHPKLSMLQPAASETDEEDITMENSDDDQEGQTALFGQHSDIEEWNSQEDHARKRPTPKKSRLTPMQLISPPPPIFEADVKAAQQNARKVKKVSSSLGGLEDELDVLSLAPSGEKKKKRQTDRKPNLASRESGGAEEKQLRRSTRARS
ncbi:hypothetical protein K474DRAFT_1705062 [Panus rudis PR-1116 ss-1]|nr:hypothetical protein K474DRAFT_1705062 [Panus rudis PR-1116 ss-1]